MEQRAEAPRAVPSVAMGSVEKKSAPSEEGGGLQKTNKKAPGGHDLVKEIAPTIGALAALIIALHS